jgi:hypothetical protein
MKIALSRIGQKQRPRAAQKKPNTQLRLELLNLSAYRRLAEKKLRARLGKREMPRRRLESLQQVEGR